MYLYIFTYIYKQRVSKEKINSEILQKFFNKHQRGFSNVCQSKQELLDLVY